MMGDGRANFVERNFIRNIFGENRILLELRQSVDNWDYLWKS